eukprot:TRINITY_DN2261_c0_g1_i3.p2 TRINITY_DN2261_c0_g1~~TRINITY_DN2261_c0_g1_i3.p2  ORF type:complete len:113 (+),score=35.74 TRINITY_DN2261_c0_g1_i3:273-611(+)
MRIRQASPSLQKPCHQEERLRTKRKGLYNCVNKALPNIEDHLVALLFLSALNYSSLLASSSPSSSSSSSSSINLCKEGLCYIFHAMEQAPRKPWPRAWEIADTEWKQQQFSE